MIVLREVNQFYLLLANIAGTIDIRYQGVRILSCNCSFYIRACELNEKCSVLTHYKHVQCEITVHGL